MPRSLKKDFQFFAIPQLTILPQLRNLHHHRVQNDILRSIDDGGRVMLLLLDMSAAFDTVDHNILLSRLSTSFGINGKALAWFRYWARFYT